MWITIRPVRFKGKRLKGYSFSLIDVSEKETTSLKAIMDPGKELIWYAAFFMLAGFGITFFTAHSRIWLIYEQEEGNCTVITGGFTSKNLPLFEETFKNIAKSIRGTDM
jgi:cytochrome c biogenesis protein ResB